MQEEKTVNNMKKEQLRLYAVTDRTWLGNETLYQQVEKALEGGATLVQLREKELPEADVQKEAEELLELCHRYGVKLILDDDVELAAKVGADGVHIGQSDMELAHAREILGPDKIIGVTAKTVEQAKAAEAGGADQTAALAARRQHPHRHCAGTLDGAGLLPPLFDLLARDARGVHRIQLEACDRKQDGACAHRTHAGALLRFDV